MTNQEISNSNDKLILLKNERDKLVRESFSTKIEKIWELNRLAITAYKSGFEDFAYEIFEIVFDLLSKPDNFYEYYDLLRSLNQTNFRLMTEQINMILYDFTENFRGDLTDELLLKLKLFEVSNDNFKEKLDDQILAILFNHAGEYWVNQSLSDSLSVFVNYLIKSNSIKIAKGILIIFQEYLIEIVEQMIFENEQFDNQVKLKDFYQIIKQDEIGTKKYCELELLICKL
jgi:hypothetical protein